MIATDTKPETAQPQTMRAEEVAMIPEQEVPVLEFVHPIPGFPELRHFVLVELDEAGILCQLRSVEDDAVRFLVVPPQNFFAGYEAEIDDATVADLGIASAEDVLVLVMLNPAESLAETTANLLAPIVINTVDRRAAQVILDADLPIRAPLGI